MCVYSTVFQIWYVVSRWKLQISPTSSQSQLSPWLSLSPYIPRLSFLPSETVYVYVYRITLIKSYDGNLSIIYVYIYIIYIYSKPDASFSQKTRVALWVGISVIDWKTFLSSFSTVHHQELRSCVDYAHYRDSVEKAIEPFVKLFLQNPPFFFQRRNRIWYKFLMFLYVQLYV